MSHLFSMPAPFSSMQEVPPHPMDLRLLPSEELVSLWEHTQEAAWFVEARGMDPGPAQHYSQLVVWELQRRLSQEPSLLLDGRESGDGDPETQETRPDQDNTPVMPRIVMVRV